MTRRVTTRQVVVCRAAVCQVVAYPAMVRRAPDRDGLVDGSPGPVVKRTAGRDRGSATVLVLGLCLAAIFLATAAAGLGSALVARHRAESVADLAALAAADVVLGRAPGLACAAAGRVVARHPGATLRACQPTADAAEVRVAVRPSGWVALLGDADARARAGRAIRDPVAVGSAAGSVAVGSVGAGSVTGVAQRWWAR